MTPVRRSEDRKDPTNFPAWNLRRPPDSAAPGVRRPTPLHDTGSNPEYLDNLEQDLLDTLQGRDALPNRDAAPSRDGFQGRAAERERRAEPPAPPATDRRKRLLRKVGAFGIGIFAVAVLGVTGWSTVQEFVLAPRVVELPTLNATRMEGTADETLPLGISTSILVPGAVLGVSGYPAGTRFSPGMPGKSGEWVIRVADLSVASVTPPRGYRGPIRIAAEMRDKDQRTLARTMVEPSWASPAPQASETVAQPKVSTQAEPQPAARAEVRRIAPAELQMLIRRGEDLLKDGDKSSARLLLERAAEAGNARAAYLMAMSYDPPSPGAAGVKDTEAARTWLRRAADLGSTEATQRLGASAVAAPR